MNKEDYKSENSNPEFSVLMSVYYKENSNYLDKALESIFKQTVMPNEVILVEDGKLTKELDEVINKYENQYANILKVIKYAENRGLGVALHDGILQCTNEIIFRMDSDDICVNDRFEKQLNIFKNRDVDVVGANIVEYDEKMENITSYRVVPENDSDIKKFSKKRNPINHMSVAYKKSAVLEAGNYQSMLYFEDYYLWARMIKNNCNFYNVQSNLIKARGGNEMIKRRGEKKYIKPIINFEKALLNIKFINYPEYVRNVIQRVIVSLIPNNVRLLVYKKFLRK